MVTLITNRRLALRFRCFSDSNHGDEARALITAFKNFVSSLTHPNSIKEHSEDPMDEGMRKL